MSNKTEVGKFLNTVQQKIDEEGLLGISGTRFDRGDSLMRVLKAKQWEARAYSDFGVLTDALEGKRSRKGKFVSVARIAQEMNAMFKAIDSEDCRDITNEVF